MVYSSSSMSPRQILSELVDLYYQMKFINVEYIDLSELATGVYRLTFDHIKNYIYYAQQVKSDDSFEIHLPTVDESTLSIFKSNQLPPSGFFCKVRSDVIKKCSGILVVKISGFESYINTSDNRYLKDRLIFSDETNFIYDFVEQVYIQVPKQKLDSTQKKLQNSGLQMQQIKDSTVKEFIVREKSLNEYLSQLKPLAIEKQKQLDALEELKIRVESKSSIISFLTVWWSFLDDFDTWVYLKFFYLQISVKEVSLLQKKSEELLNDVLIAIDCLNSLGEDLSNISSYDMNYHKYKYVVDTQLKLASSFNNRSLTSEDGYFKVKDESGKYDIVENFKEIENRNRLASEKYTREDIEQEKKNLLEKWNGSN